jgi:hypothetical protein
MYQVQSVQTSVEKHFRLSMEHARRLSHLARARGIDEDQVVEKALDILLSLSDFLDEGAERQGWSVLAEASLQRAWDNDADANYDNWRALYDVQSR